MEPNVKKTRSDVEQMVRQSFPAEQFEAVMALLDGIKKEPEEARIIYQLQIIPLSFGKIELLRQWMPRTFKVDRSNVEEIVRRDFPPEQFNSAMSILDEIKKDSEDLRAHFQINVLKQSQGNMERLRQNVDNCDKKVAAQPVPKVTRKIVERVVRRDFPAEKVAAVMAILDEYGKEKYEREVDRVQLDILKLAGGKFESLPELLKQAKSDYRDVISWAEYPSYRWDAYRLPAEEQKKIFTNDWQQYLAWANAK